MVKIQLHYCRFGNIRKNFIFANNIKSLRHTSDVNNLQLRHDLPKSINERVILPFREGLISMKLRIWDVLQVLAKFPNL